MLRLNINGPIGETLIPDSLATNAQACGVRDTANQL